MVLPVEVFVVVGLLVVAGGVALGVGDDVCGVLTGDDGPDEGPLVLVVVLVGAVPAVLLDGVLLGPGACVALPPLQLLPTQTGALPFAGVLVVAAGVTPTVPTGTVPIEWVTSCDPSPVVVLVLLEPAELCVEFLRRRCSPRTPARCRSPVRRRGRGVDVRGPDLSRHDRVRYVLRPATATRAAAAAGPAGCLLRVPSAAGARDAHRDVPVDRCVHRTHGSTRADPTCPVRIDCVTVCGPPPPVVVLLVGTARCLPGVPSAAGACDTHGSVAVHRCVCRSSWIDGDSIRPEATRPTGSRSQGRSRRSCWCCRSSRSTPVEFAPLHVLATHTGALAFAGAFAAAAGFTPADPT